MNALFYHQNNCQICHYITTKTSVKSKCHEQSQGCVTLKGRAVKKCVTIFKCISKDIIKLKIKLNNKNKNNNNNTNKCIIFVIFGHFRTILLLEGSFKENMIIVITLTSKITETMHLRQLQCMTDL